MLLDRQTLFSSFERTQAKQVRAPLEIRLINWDLDFKARFFPTKDVRAEVTLVVCPVSKTFSLKLCNADATPVVTQTTQVVFDGLHK